MIGSGTHECFRCHRDWRRRDSRWHRGHVLKDLGTHLPQLPAIGLGPTGSPRARVAAQAAERSWGPPADVVATAKHGGAARTPTVHSTKPQEVLVKGPTALTPDDRFVRVAVRKRRSRFAGWDRLA